MKDVPKEINGAKVVSYSPLDQRHKATGNCVHQIGGQILRAVSGLAICRHTGENCYYLFYCDEDWSVLTDTWHETLNDAKHQAEFEYEGISNSWIQNDS